MGKTGILVFVSVLLFVDGAYGGYGWRGGGGYGKNAQGSKMSYAERNGKYQSEGNVSDSTAPKPRSNPRRSLGISAWAIVGIVVATIVLTTVGYYAFILYPYVCKKQESYDMMELNDV